MTQELFFKILQDFFQRDMKLVNELYKLTIQETKASSKFKIDKSRKKRAKKQNFKLGFKYVY